jgi:tetratricopeptide (TPR) repeat protein
MVYYYLGYFAEKMGQGQKASQYYQLASTMPTDYVFPFQSELIGVFQAAMKANPRDARAPYYLGNLLYDWQPELATKQWEASAALDPKFAIVERNLSVAYMHQKSGADISKAIAALEKAVSCDRRYPLHFAELDELYEQARTPIEKRLPLFEQNMSVVAQRDDALNRAISLKVAMGKYDEAIELLARRQFAVAEGANLNIVDQWINAHMLRGQRNVDAKRYKEALTDFQAAVEIPSNIPTESITVSARNSEVAYWMGVAYDGMGDPEKARQSWNKGAVPPETEPSRRPGQGANLLVTGAQSYYQALSLQKLGQDSQAKTVFDDLVRSAEKVLQEPLEEAVQSGGGRRRLMSPQTREATAHYLAGLGYLGLKDMERARKEFTAAVQTSPDLLGARTALAALR